MKDYLLLLVLVLVGALVLGLGLHKYQECSAKGGRLVHGVCISKKSVIKL